MPRTTKTVETRIMEIEAQRAKYQARIESIKAKISDLDGKIQALKSTKQQKEVQQLLKAIKASGKTPEEVLSDMQRFESAS